MERTKTAFQDAQIAAELRDGLLAQITPLEDSKIALRELTFTDEPNLEVEFAARLIRTAVDVLLGQIKSLNLKLGLTATGGQRK